jgi:phage-related protein
MALMTGYSFVRADGLNDFLQSFTRRSKKPAPEVISIVQFLRDVRRQAGLPHQCVRVQGFDRLFVICDDEKALRREVRDVLSGAKNWLQNQNGFVYFALPAETTFNQGEHLCLRVPRREEPYYLDLELLFGKLQRISADHYHKPFNIDS